MSTHAQEYEITFAMVDGVEGIRKEFLGHLRTIMDRRDKHLHTTYLSPAGRRFKNAILALQDTPFVPRLLDHDRHDLNWFTLEYLGETHIQPNLFIFRCKNTGNHELFEQFVASMETFFQTLAEKRLYFDNLDLQLLSLILVHKETGQIKITDFSDFYRKELLGDDEDAGEDPCLVDFTEVLQKKTLLEIHETFM
jgi:hypothetical protein